LIIQIAKNASILLTNRVGNVDAVVVIVVVVGGGGGGVDTVVD
jgi:hypothetical protein